MDITGGAPELNPHFRMLVTEVGLITAVKSFGCRHRWLAWLICRCPQARAMGRTVIDRCNLVVLFEQGQEDLHAFLAENEVQIVASLPCYTEENTTKQRGKRVFEDR